jgi:hypothetical protein
VLSFPFSQENPKGPERTHQDTIEDAKQAMLTKKPCYGVKGPSWLAGLEHYDIIKGTGIDYMHAVLLGNMKKPLYGHRHQTANIHSLVHLVDSVRQLGPLWTNLCFNFEDKNGFLLKTVHGTQQIHFQIIPALSMLKCLPELEK